MAEPRDIIELGSSDEEPQPPAKKVKPNAMVHIPGKLPEVTIKPTSQLKPKSNVKQKERIIFGKPLNMQAQKLNTNLAKLSTKDLTINKINKPITKVPLQKPIQVINMPLINPACSLIKNNPQMINKLTFSNLPKKASIVYTPNLPSDLTIKKTGKQIVKNNRRPHKKPYSAIREISYTVEIDDDELSPSPVPGPQWYLTPEEHDESDNLKKLNNTEPEPKKFIEITIEDSPIKPVANKKTCENSPVKPVANKRTCADSSIKPVANKRTREISTEQAITIEDSPVKPVVVNDDQDSEGEIKKVSEKEPQSKKQLKYPIESNTIEIEIDMMDVSSSNTKIAEVPSVSADQKNPDSIEIDVRLKNNTENESATIEIDLTPNENHKEENSNVNEQNNNNGKEGDDLKTDDVSNIAEFHPVYQGFIDLCFRLENSDDMKKIVEKKIKTYYRQVPKDYTESEEFIDMVSSKIIAMKAGPEKMYLYIKDIVDELNLQRKLSKSTILEKEPDKPEQEGFPFGEHSEFDSKRQRQIRKLEKTLKKLHRAIQKLEEQEVDFDDDEDSVYLLTERYKERMVRVHTKFCQLTNTKMPSEPHIRIEARPGQPAGPIKRLEKWINKKVPIGTPLPFPDFHDVLRCVRDANEEDKLGWNEVDIMEQARDLFSRCGKKLQRRRQENEWRSAYSRISTEVDPAETYEDLKKKLDENHILATKKESEILNKYADRQNLLKLEAEEIGDRGVDESPVESDDEPNEESSLGNKEKRKERLKRLLQEKSRKASSESKENQPSGNNEDIKGIDSNEKADNNASVIQEKLSDIKETNMDVDDPTPDCNDKDDKLNTEDIHTLSDDSKRIDSDMDELHLLQKLHSENEASSSTLESSDSESPIAISDTLDSNSDTESQKTQALDVISIENSSYSESESVKSNKDKKIESASLKASKDKNIESESPKSKKSKKIESDSPKDHKDKKIASNKQITENMMDANIEVECSNLGIVNQSKNIVQDDSAIEDILLHSSDDECEGTIKEPSITPNDVCVDLRDDYLSIGDTIIEGQQNQHICDDDIVNKRKIVNLTAIPEEIEISSVNSGGKSTDDVNSIQSIGSVESVELVPEEAKSDNDLQKSRQLSNEVSDECNKDKTVGVFENVEASHLVVPDKILKKADKPDEEVVNKYMGQDNATPISNKPKHDSDEKTEYATGKNEASQVTISDKAFDKSDQSERALQIPISNQPNHNSLENTVCASEKDLTSQSPVSDIKNLETIQKSAKNEEVAKNNEVLENSISINNKPEVPQDEEVSENNFDETVTENCDNVIEATIFNDD